MIIAQISDTHIDLGNPDAESRFQDFADTIADINTLDPAPDVIVHTGDIVHNGLRDEYERAAAILAEALAPVFVLAGNKDDRANLHAVFAGHGYLAPKAEFIDYAVEGFPVRLIALDTLSLRSHKGDFCNERAGRLIDLIDAEPSKPIAVFTHHPPYAVTEWRDAHHFESKDMAMRLRATMLGSERVRAVFSGHVHRASVGNVETIPATAMPSIATNLRNGEYPEHMKSRPVYYLHQFDPEAGFISQSRIVGTR